MRFILFRCFLILLVASGFMTCSEGPSNSKPNSISSHFSGVDSDDNYYYSTDNIYDFFNPHYADQYFISAHRGSRYYDGWPENCLESFDFVMHQLPAVLEMDLRLSSDSVVFLLHDQTLDRTTTGAGQADQFTFEEIAKLKLLDHIGDTTSFSPPTLREVLEWSEGKSILKLDIKRNVPFEMVIDEIRETNAVHRVIVIVYSLNAARVFHRLAPDVMISLPVRNMAEFEEVANSELHPDRLLAFTGIRRTTPEVFENLNNFGILAIQGTIGNLDQQAKARGFEKLIDFFYQGAHMLATDYPIELYNHLKSHHQKE